MFFLLFYILINSRIIDRGAQSASEVLILIPPVGYRYRTTSGS